MRGQAQLHQSGRAKRRIATVAAVAAGFLGVGLPAASAHTGGLVASGVCQSNGTRLVTYTGTTLSVPGSGNGHTATLTVTNIVPSGSTVSPMSQPVVGNTSFSFSQIINGDAHTASATASLAWGDGVSASPTGQASFTTNCTPPVVVPEKPTPEVVVTQSEVKNCATKSVTTTTVTTTTDWVLKDNKWVKTGPVSTETVTSRAVTQQECTVVVPPVVVHPAVPPVVGHPAVPPLTVAGVVAKVPVVVSPAEAAMHPLPVAAAAGQADTSGQLALGGFAGFAAFLALGAGFLLRRRQGEV